MPYNRAERAVFDEEIIAEGTSSTLFALFGEWDLVLLCVDILHCGKWEKLLALQNNIWNRYHCGERRIYCQRRGAKRIKLAVESFFPQSHGTLKQRDLCGTINLINMAYGTRMALLDHVLDIPADRLVPAITLFDGLSLSQLKRYKLNFYMNYFFFQNYRIKFWIENRHWFRKSSVSCIESFSPFFFHIFRV